MFKTHTIAKDEIMLLGDAHVTNVTSIGDVELTFIFGKTLILMDVMHNLISRFLLNKKKFSPSTGTNLYTFAKNSIFVRKRYATNDMFKLNVEMNKMFVSVYYVILIFMLDLVILINTLFLI